MTATQELMLAKLREVIHITAEVAPRVEVVRVLRDAADALEQGKATLGDIPR